MYLIEQSLTESMTMNEIVFDEECDVVVAGYGFAGAVAAIEAAKAAQCTMPNSASSMSTAPRFLASTRRVRWVAASAISTSPVATLLNASFPDGPRAAPLPASHPGEAHAGSHLAAELP